MGFADYLGEPGCIYSCEQYKAREADLCAIEERAFEKARVGPTQAVAESSQRTAQEILMNARYDREELESLARSCDRSACALITFSLTETSPAINIDSPY